MARKPGYRRASAGPGTNARSAVRSRTATRNAIAPDHRAEVGTRAKRSAERRDAILTAALKEFSERGFAATRLDDVARRAGVAKGTIYLHFADKETLFQELIRTELNPVVGALVQASHTEVPVRAITEQLIELFVREIHGTHRKDVIRLVLTEGPRFPALAEFYYREVIARVMAAVRDLMRRAHERGEIRSDALLRFPQLIAAPMVVAILWSALFDRFEPLDVRALLRAHFELIFDDRRAP